ncbi:hypothetical protein H7J86_24370 [Mycobacterium hackensackense]|uniref:hypothetical protein n=1 Tax=Mycobacterium hackensackense TaxID=228909 RepID=UPI002265A706|nr:hypothetical protein [Mycobacterium hackensackense]MCV7255303.1 hypothetical protein [Mycobacterium hackensackense]
MPDAAAVLFYALVAAGCIIAAALLVAVHQRSRTPSDPGPDTTARLPYGPIVVRVRRDRISLVDVDTDTILASTSWLIRAGNLVNLTQDGDRFTVTVAEDDGEDTPRRPVLEWIRPALREELDEIEGDHRHV